MSKNEKRIRIFFAIAVAASFLLGLSVALMHPAQWLVNNRDVQWFTVADGILFWISLLVLLAGQLLGKHMAKKLSAVHTDGTGKAPLSRKWYRKLFATKEAMAFAAVFLIGLVVTAAILCVTRFSTVQTFLAAGFAVFGIANYINFNSKSYQIVRENFLKNRASKKKGRK